MVKCEECGKKVARRKSYVTGGVEKKVCDTCHTELSVKSFSSLADAIIGKKPDPYLEGLINRKPTGLEKLITPVIPPVLAKMHKAAGSQQVYEATVKEAANKVAKDLRSRKRPASNRAIDGSLTDLCDSGFIDDWEDDDFIFERAEWEQFLADVAQAMKQ